MQIKMKRQKYENKKWIRVLRYKKVIIQEACKIHDHKGINNNWHQWLNICWEIRHFFCHFGWKERNGYGPRRASYRRKKLLCGKTRIFRNKIEILWNRLRAEWLVVLKLNLELVTMCFVALFLAFAIFWLTTYYSHGHNLVLLNFTIKQLDIFQVHLVRGLIDNSMRSRLSVSVSPR